LGGEVVAPLRVQGEGEVVGINGEGAGAGGIDADADNLRRREAGISRRLFERGAYGFFQPADIIAGELAGEVVVARIEEDTLLPAGVVYDGSAELASIPHIHDQSAY
jgi:hypothetical protein